MKVENLKEYDSTFELYKELKPTFEITTISDTQEISDHSLVFVKNKKFFTSLIEKNLSPKKIALIVEKKFFESLDSNQLDQLNAFCFMIGTTSDVNVSMSKISKYFYEKKFHGINDLVDGRQMGTASVHPTAYIAQNVFIGENVKIHAYVKIHPGCVIMAGTEIEAHTEIYPNVSIYRNVKIGKNVRIHSGTVIGADGFGYNFFQGEHLKVWHLGSVILEDNVEIGASSSIDGGTFSPTIIGEGTKIDNQVQVAHNCRVGKKVIICGNVALAGSCTLHDYVVIGGMASVGNGVVVGTAAQIAAYAGVISDVGPKEVVGGFPARDHKEWMRGVATLRKLSQPKAKE